MSVPSLSRAVAVVRLGEQLLRLVAAFRATTGFAMRTHHKGGHMTILMRFSTGRILLHLLAMSGDRSVRFHVAGIVRELSTITAAVRTGTRARLIGRLVRYLSQPSKQLSRATRADAQALAGTLERGDVLLSEGTTRLAALVKRFTRSRWSHVSMYVGPLGDGWDPPCIVEADIAAGVRAIRLSELDAVRVRVLRPGILNDTERSCLADWVAGRIGSEYDVAHAWAVGRGLLHLRWWRHSRTSRPRITNDATRFICCSLLAHAFALIGYPIVPLPVLLGMAGAADYGLLTPGDFERAGIFEVLPWMSIGF